MKVVFQNWKVHGEAAGEGSLILFKDLSTGQTEITPENPNFLSGI
jgi:hypothetical protein